MAPPRGAVGLNLLGQPDTSELVMRALNIKGRLPQLLDPTFGLSLTVDDWTRPEYDYLRRMQRWHASGSVAAVAGQFGYLVFGRNAPLGDRQALAVVEKVLISNATAAAQWLYVYLLQNPAAIGVGTLSEPTDDRNNQGILSRVSMFTVGFGNAAADFHPLPALIVRVGADETFSLDVPWILSNTADGTGQSQLVIQHNAVNTAFVASIFWRERLMLDAEQ